MKVGEYVRTEDDLGVQLICKIKARFNDFCNTDEGYWDDNHIIKSSPNMIDLIEVGDYVNGKKVIDKWEESDWYGYFIKLDGEETVPTIRKIESIVTKEQFSQMEYRIKNNGGTNGE